MNKTSKVGAVGASGLEKRILSVWVCCAVNGFVVP